ncbi:putative mitochondrial carrier protein [Yarrowia sp. B02]|nr:putative mitochondrial carrier protein [Yarrowia sp. B02]
MSDNLALISLLSGGIAGTCTDLCFFPIDTLKTRLQAKGGFFVNGGWHGVYRGVGSAIVASAPGASLFFLTYEYTKTHLTPHIRALILNDDAAQGVTHMIGASLGEVAACMVRVPSEVIKQRAQTGHYKSSMEALKSILNNSSGEGVLRGLYRGYATTIVREIPFTMIQFPLYEYLKKKWARATQRDVVTSKEAAVCGSFAGGVAAAITTPLDVIKTRLMLHKQRQSFFQTYRQIVQTEGYSALLKGIGPRTMWISAGGAIFLGVYETAKKSLTALLDKPQPKLE